MNKTEVTKLAKNIITGMYEKELNAMKQAFSEDSIPEDLIYDIIADKLLKNEPKPKTSSKPKPKIYRRRLFHIVTDGMTTYQILQYNPRTDHITISAGFIKQRKS